MDFVKMEGLGNDFVVVEGPVDIEPAMVERWCERRHGIGADGVIEVTKVDDRKVRMRYWNADGAAAEMCGNGLRCVARYARQKQWVTEPAFIVETPVGDRPVEVFADGTVHAYLGEAHVFRTPTLRVAGETVYPAGVGNPHAVLFVTDPETVDVAVLGARIENDPIFPEGTNVEFVTVESPDRIRMRVWERGVGETLACGTGAAAAAFVASQQGHTEQIVTVSLPGGDLRVEIADGGVWIEGPAVWVFSGWVD